MKKTSSSGGSLIISYWSFCGRECGGGGRLLTFSAFRMGAYLRLVLIRGWALIRINTVVEGTVKSLFVATLRKRKIRFLYSSIHF